MMNTFIIESHPYLNTTIRIPLTTKIHSSNKESTQKLILLYTVIHLANIQDNKITSKLKSCLTFNGIHRKLSNLLEKCTCILK